MALRTLKILAVVALIISLSGNVVFAAPVGQDAAKQEQTDTVKKDKKDFRKKKEGFDGQQDPVKMLEEKKERVQGLLKEGKLTKDEADEITAKIDARIQKIREFNSLTLPQKKDALIASFKTRMEKKVKEGKVSREEADSRIRSYTDKVNKWDGSGNPGFLKKDCDKSEHKKGEHKKSKTDK